MVRKMIKGDSLIFIGIAAIIIGMIFIFLGTALQSTSKTENGEQVKTGGIVLIGPIPIIFGNDKNMVIMAIIAAIIIIILSYLLFYRGSP
jgi:uncharacterized protein (TIGR00304 family)